MTSTVAVSGSSTPVPSTVVQTITTGGSTITQNVLPTSASSAPATVSSSAAPFNGTDAGASPSSTPAPGVIAAAVVVPVAVVALLIAGSLFFWKKRKQRKEAEEARKKEMEEYSFNPNNDPTIPAVGSANGDEGETGGGYRGWGTTSSATRKASTTLSSGMARSDSGGAGYRGQHSPNNPSGFNFTENGSGDPLMEGDGHEPIGALGAAPVAGTKSSGVNRGPSNASSAYSGGANRSDTSGEGPSPIHATSPQQYYDFMSPEGGLPHDNVDGSWGGGQPVIKDVSARRNTRIENPSVFHQQGNSGIAQNF